LRFIIAILILGLVIIFHEFGHFIVAKTMGIHVLEFAVGMGPKLFSIKRGSTRYSLRLIPFGGYCAMQDEITDTEPSADPTEEGEEGRDSDVEIIPGAGFNEAPVRKRIPVILAGPFFNFLMAFIASAILIAFAGIDPARVVEVYDGSPAQEAGIEAGDIITRYEENGIANARELYTDMILNEVPTDEIHISYKRDGRTYSVTYAPETTTSYKLGFYFNDTGEGLEISRIMQGSNLKSVGIQTGDVIVGINGNAIASYEDLAAYLEKNPLSEEPVDLTYERNGHEKTVEGVRPVMETTADIGFSYNLMREKTSLPGVLKNALGEVGYWIHVTVQSILSLFKGTFTITDMQGPVGVVKVVGDAYQEASAIGVETVVMTLLNIIILLSANLGVMNLIPIPALDGGRIVMLIVEAIRRKPSNREIEARVNFVSFVVLMALMVYITAHDIFKLF